MLSAKKNHQKKKLKKIKKKIVGNFAKFFDVFARFSKLSDMFRPIRICSDLLGCVRMHSDAFGSVWTLSKKIDFFKFLNWFSMVSDVALQETCVAAQ